MSPSDASLIDFRPLTESDMPLLHKWLNTPHVLEWYRDWGAAGPTLEQVAEKFLPRALDQTVVQSYIILHDGQAIGHIQTYRIGDFPAASGMVGGDAGGLAGVDILIGEAAHVHRGLGSHLLRAFLKEIVFADPSMTTCVIDPEPENRIAIRAYEKTGFHYTHTAWNPEDKVRAYMMLIRREAIRG